MKNKDSPYTYFPDGNLGQRKEHVYQHILPAEEGGLDRKSVLKAMDEYAEIYYTHKCLEAIRRAPLYYIGKNGKMKRISTPYSRWKNRVKIGFQYRWLQVKYWWKSI